MRVLFITPWCLLDSTNGGAVSMRRLLRGLTADGVECAAVNDALFTDLGAFNKRSLTQVLRARRLRGSRKKVRGAPYVEVRDGQVEYVISDPTPKLRPEPTDREREAFLTLVDRELTRYAPDVVMTWPRDQTTEPRIHELARKRGAAVIAHVLTADFELSRPMIAGSAMVLASSRFCADTVADRLGLRPEVLYPIIDPSRVVTSRQGARYVTFANPLPEKGLALFLKIAERAQYDLPDVRFLVVEGRWTDEIIEHVAIGLDAFPNIRTLPNQADVREVYARTRLLLFPSLWRESFGMMVVEAQLNGIPVIASRRGGIPEALNGAGVLLDPPARCVADHDVIPNAREIRPWLRAIDRLSSDSAERRRMSREARRAAGVFTAESIIPAAREYLARAVSKKRRKSA